MLRPVPYLSQKLTQPLPTKDGGTLRTVLMRAPTCSHCRRAAR